MNKSREGESQKSRVNSITKLKRDRNSEKRPREYKVWKVSRKMSIYKN